MMQKLVNEGKEAEKESQDFKESLKKYEELLEKKTAITTKFDKVDDKGTFEKFDNGVVLRMPMEESCTARKFELSRRPDMMRRNYAVLVQKIEGNVVTVSHVDYLQNKYGTGVRGEVVMRITEGVNAVRKALEPVSDDLMAKAYKMVGDMCIDHPMKSATKSYMVKRIFMDLQTEYKKEHHIRRMIVPATVEAVYKDTVVVNIFELAIYGKIPARNWADITPNNLTLVVPVGKTVDVEVLGIDNMKSDAISKKYTDCWYCARRTIAPDPWDFVTTHYKKNDMVSIRCIEVIDSVGSPHWSGVVEGVDDLVVYCEMPKRDRMPIIVGRTYRCYFYVINRERRILRARTFDDSNATNAQ